MSPRTPIACNLEKAERPVRAEALAALGGRLVAIDAKGRRATLEFEPGAEEEIAELVEAEARCCPFFEFEQETAADAAVLRIGVPHGGEWALRGVVAGFAAGWRALV